MRLSVCDRCFYAEHKIVEAKYVLSIPMLVTKTPRPVYAKVKGDLCEIHSKQAKGMKAEAFNSWLIALDKPAQVIVSEPKPVVPKP